MPNQTDNSKKLTAEQVRARSVEILQEIEDIRRRAGGKVEDLERNVEKIKSACAYICGDPESDDPTRSISAQASEITEEILYIKKEVETLLESVKDNSDEVIDLKREIETTLEDLQKASRELFGYTKIELRRLGDGERSYSFPEPVVKDGEEFVREKTDIPGKITEIEELLTELKKASEEQQASSNSLMEKSRTDFEESHLHYTKEMDSLREKIEGLLPGATAAGLSKAYDDAKASHKESSRLWSWVFIGSLGLMVGALLCLIWFKAVSFSLDMTLSEVAAQALKILTIELPLIWLAAASNKKLNQHLRLHEDYLHKWSVAMTFEGLRKKAEEVDDKTASKHLNDLFQNFLAANAYNPCVSFETSIKTDMPIQVIKDELESLTDNLTKNISKLTDPLTKGKT